MKKLSLITGLLALVLVAGCSTLKSWFDLDGNGRIDPIAYLESADITVAWTDENGQVYNMAVDELGRRIIGQFIQAKTGYLFGLDDAGGITITDAKGRSVTISRSSDGLEELLGAPSS